MHAISSTLLMERTLTDALAGGVAETVMAFLGADGHRLILSLLCLTADRVDSPCLSSQLLPVLCTTMCRAEMIGRLLCAPQDAMVGIGAFPAIKAVIIDDVICPEWSKSVFDGLVSPRDLVVRELERTPASALESLTLHLDQQLPEAVSTSKLLVDTEQTPGFAVDRAIVRCCASASRLRSLSLYVGHGALGGVDVQCGGGLLTLGGMGSWGLAQSLENLELSGEAVRLACQPLFGSFETPDHLQGVSSSILVVDFSGARRLKSVRLAAPGLRIAQASPASFAASGPSCSSLSDSAPPTPRWSSRRAVAIRLSSSCTRLDVAALCRGNCTIPFIQWVSESNPTKAECLAHDVADPLAWFSAQCNPVGTALRGTPRGLIELRLPLHGRTSISRTALHELLSVSGGTLEHLTAAVCCPPAWEVSPFAPTVAQDKTRSMRATAVAFGLDGAAVELPALESIELVHCSQEAACLFSLCVGASLAEARISGRAVAAKPDELISGYGGPSAAPNVFWEQLSTRGSGMNAPHGLALHAPHLKSIVVTGVVGLGLSLAAPAPQLQSLRLTEVGAVYATVRANSDVELSLNAPACKARVLSLMRCGYPLQARPRDDTAGSRSTAVLAIEDMAVPENGLEDWVVGHCDNRHDISLRRVRGIDAGALRAAVEAAPRLQRLQVLGSDLHEPSAASVLWALADDHSLLDEDGLTAILGTECETCIVERQWGITSNANGFVESMRSRGGVAIVRAEFGV